MQTAVGAGLRARPLESGKLRLSVIERAGAETRPYEDSEHRYYIRMLDTRMPSTYTKLGKIGKKMHRIKFACLLVTLAVLSTGRIGAQPSAVPSATLTIDQAVAMALQNNTAVRAAQDEVAAARARVTEARSSEYPQVAGTVQYTHNTNVPSFEFPSPVPGQPATNVSLTPVDNTFATITARQALYTGGMISGTVSRAEALYDVSLGRLGTTQTQLALQARQAYYSVLLNQALVQSSLQNLDAAKKQLSDANAKFEAGTAARFDVLRAETQVSEADQALTQNRNQVQISTVALNRIIGVPLNTSHTLVEPALAPLPTTDLPSLISTAEKQRAEVLSAKAQVKAAEYGVRVARSAAYPQVGATATYQNVFNTNPTQVTGWTFGASVSQEIFDAGRIKGTIREAKALRDESQVNLKDTTDAVEQDVRQAYLNLQTARQTLDTASTRLAQASEAYDVATTRYEAGVGTATELADALATLTAARANVDTSRFNYNLNFATLQRTLGLATY